MSIKLCMIGSRGHWHYVFQSIKDVENIELVAVSSGGEDNMTNLINKAKELGYEPKVYDDYLEMLDKEEPAIAVVDAQFEKHAEYSIECLKRNISVFCEKPVALTLEDLDKLESAYKNSNAKIFSMIGLRYEAPFQTALDLVKAGAIGKVKLISTRKSYRLGERPAYYKKRATYGGTIPWVGSHAVDWIMAFSGCFEVVKIDALNETTDNFNHGELEVAASCQFLMANGVIAQASIDYLRPAKASTHGDDQVRVAGTTGVIEVAHGKVFLINEDGERYVDCVAKCNIFSDFVLDVLGKKTAITSSEETFALTRACLEAQISADKNYIA